jgi:maleate isomerase
MYRMAPPGITLHTSRMYVEPDYMYTDDEGFLGLLQRLRGSLPRAVDDAASCRPDCMVLGVSSESLWDGHEGAAKLQQEIASRAGVPAYTPAFAVDAALQALGAKRVAVLTPYQSIADQHVRVFLQESGVEIADMQGLRLETATQIASQTAGTIVARLTSLAQTKPDCILQMGSNIPMIDIADQAEHWLGLPVIAINSAIMWHALRQNGITDRFRGFGVLLRDF